MGKVGTGVKFSCETRRTPGNVTLTDEFQSQSNSNLLIGRKFPQLSFFRPIREPHTVKSDPSYQEVNTTSTVAILFLSLSLSGSYPAMKIWVAKGPAKSKVRQIHRKDFVK